MITIRIATTTSTTSSPTTAPATALASEVSQILGFKSSLVIAAYVVKGREDLTGGH